jgi:hypothetical protein
VALIDFDEWLSRHPKDATPKMALAATMHFKSRTMHVWLGRGPVVAPGRTFEGIGTVASVTGLELGYGRPTAPLTITISGLDQTFFGLAADQESEVRGRRMEIFLLGFGGTGVAGEEWTLAAMSQEGVREMDQMTRKIDYDSGTSVITLTAQPISAMRWRMAAGLLTHEDQQALYPSDRGLERVPLTQYSRPLKF